MFDELLPNEHNTRVMCLLFTAAHWHGLVKLCMHTEITLTIFEKLTKELGEELCQFWDTTCKTFDTWELEREINAWLRRDAKKPSNLVCSIIRIRFPALLMYHFLGSLHRGSSYEGRLSLEGFQPQYTQGSQFRLLPHMDPSCWDHQWIFHRAGESPSVL